MGRGRHRGRSQRKHYKDSRENVWKRPKSDAPVDSDNPAPASENPGWAPLITENPAFEEYYKEQRIVKPEEWDLFMEVLRKPLPAAFRVNSYGQFCDDILSKLENDFMKSLQAEAIEGGESEAIKPLPWFPRNLAWHSNFSRKQIRKVQTLQRFHEFLKLENEVGNITRQEAVSMVPPLFLDVHPDHFVLDMCAAPGSKTFQLLEIIHGSSEPGTLPNGMVVANDVDFQRSNLLIHQTKRMCTANLIVTNHEGQQFPGCRLSKGSSRVAEKGLSGGDLDLNQLSFDRVLCDVPCSGDGTLRKAPDIWRKWNSGMGNGLHGLQVLLAMRGLSLLKVGGRMIYSTCSMNPVEDEAVVAEILRRCAGSVELLDVLNELPELIRRPGLKTWKVRDKGAWFTSYKDVPKYRRGGILQSMFPSGKSYMENPENGSGDGCQGGCKETENAEAASSDESVEEISNLPLERCMRISPHDQNTGAFFIAVLQKVSPLPELQERTNPRKNLSTRSDESSAKSPDAKEDAEEKVSEAASSNDLSDSKADGDDVIEPENKKADGESVVEETQVPDGKETNTANTGGKRKLPMQGKWVGFDPVVFLKDDTVINSIKSFYGIRESFPLHGHLVTRNSDTSSVKRIYYVSKSVKDVLELNFAVGQQLKIASVGLKMFERQSSKEGTSVPCSFRISSEGLPTILPYITKQILYAPLADFKHLLQYKSIKFPDFVDQELGQKAANLVMGCCVVILNDGTQSGTEPVKVDGSTIAIGCWRGKTSLGVMVAPADCQELLERLNDRTPSVEEVESSPVNRTNGETGCPLDVETA
ncbi:PREDICTED: tRNA (cytosine(34)-C(5))-methyltransferase-like [Tarenaya hassleriana]|uniref:tRNA (cytosine(34)-C(5))-methyltransferase-like n=1 Tax=Tarenaya hassleriana TaxID=28532 RepID=UPI00053C3739|nr:PREDICTED: tRNA (cytosine(34)-C(5))-methyltransferase-like [Tarenaya hassleriana]